MEALKIAVEHCVPASERQAQAAAETGKIEVDMVQLCIEIEKTEQRLEKGVEVSVSKALLTLYQKVTAITLDGA